MRRKKLNRSLRILSLVGTSALVATVGVGAPASSQLTSKEWPTYGHDSGGMRYSPLTQITPANVTRLQLAWSYHMKPAGNASAAPVPAPPPDTNRVGGRAARPIPRFSQSEVTPLVINGLMYITTPYRKILALNAATGKEIWSHDGQGS